MKRYTAQLVKNDGDIIASFEFESNSLKYAKQYAWHKWDFSMIEGNKVLLLWDSFCLSRKVRQDVWKSEVKKGE